MGMSEAPPAPDGVTATPVSCSRVMIRWNPRDINTDFPIHKYVLQRYEEENNVTPIEASWWFMGNNSPSLESNSHLATFSWKTVADLSSQESSFEDFGLAKERTYKYRVRAMT